MKPALFFLCLFFLFSIHAAELSRRVTLNAQYEPLAKVLASITEQTGLRFSYSTQWIDANKKTSIHVSDQPLSEVLPFILPSSVVFKEVGKYIILSPQTQEKTTISKEKGEIEDKSIPLINEMDTIFIQKNDALNNGTSSDSCHSSVTTINLEDMNKKLALVVGLSAATLGNTSAQTEPKSDSSVSTKTQIESNASEIPQRIAQTTFVYPIGTDGLASTKNKYGFSFNLLGGYTGKINGFEMAGLFNLNKYSMTGAQMAGWVNLTGIGRNSNEKSKGTQMAGLVNYNYAGRSSQIAGIANLTESSIFQLGGIANINKKKTKVQIAGVGNISDTTKVQLAGIANVAKASKTQVGGVVNINKTNTRVQLAAIGNITDSTKVQVAGIANVASSSSAQTGGIVNISDTTKVQLAGIANVAKASKTQVGGVVNINKTNTRVQLVAIGNITDSTKVQVAGIANVASSSSAQIGGIVNITRKGRFQLGLVNLRDSTDGVSLGIVNIAKKNGLLEGEVSGSEILHGVVSFRSGSKKLYSIISAGYNFSDEYFGLGFGLGTEFTLSERLGLNVEAIQYNLNSKDFDNEKYNGLVQVRPTLNFKIFEHLKLFAGPTLNLSIINKDDLKFSAPYSIWKDSSSKNYDLNTWIGFTAGLRF